MKLSLCSPIPALGVGIGLKAAHYAAALRGGHALDFFEVHAENFMGAGGSPHRWLAAIRRKFELSIHGVCLSVGGRDALDREHLRRVADLARRYEPALLSEHLAWSSDGGVFFNDLLPPPLTELSLARVCGHVDQIQNAVKRQILIENPSSYLSLEVCEIPEPEFLNALAKETGCGILLDINNVAVSAFNLESDAASYIDAIDAEAVGEIHVAGHAIDRMGAFDLRIDNHAEPVSAEVFALLERFVARAGPRPVLIERDRNLPSFATLAREAEEARDVSANVWRRAAKLEGDRRCSLT